jgi:hypothetical protein
MRLMHLEANYPWPQRITAVALKPMLAFQRQFPEADCVVAGGRALPFEGGVFDIGFSNGVVEHVGSRDRQAAFVGELLRTCHRVFIATPNARFPIDPHTLLPLIHWLSPKLRYPPLRLLPRSVGARGDAQPALGRGAALAISQGRERQAGPASTLRAYGRAYRGRGPGRQGSVRRTDGDPA